MPPTMTRLQAARRRSFLAYSSASPVRFLTRSRRAMENRTGLFRSCACARQGASADSLCFSVWWPRSLQAAQPAPSGPSRGPGAPCRTGPACSGPARAEPRGFGTESVLFCVMNTWLCQPLSQNGRRPMQSGAMEDTNGFLPSSTHSRGCTANVLLGSLLLRRARLCQPRQLLHSPSARGRTQGACPRTAGARTADHAAKMASRQHQSQEKRKLPYPSFSQGPQALLSRTGPP